MEKTNTEHIDALIIEFAEQRNALKQMVEELDSIRKNVDKLFPEKLDQRYTRFFEEKVKAATELFKAIVDMRKEINKSIKDEIELRRKIDSDGDGDDFTNQIDIHAIAKKLKAFEQKKQVLLEKAQGE